MHTPIKFYDGGTRITAAGIAYASGTQKITFTPNALLSPNTTYTVTLLATIADATGNSLGAATPANDVVYTFTTEPRPTVPVTVPADTAQFIAVNSVYTATFSENMNLAATVIDDESVIKFYDNAGIPNRVTAANIAYNAGTQKLTFTPAAILSASTTYTVTILATVADLTGNTLGAATPANDVVFTFQTEPPPNVAATTPSNNAQFIAVNTTVTATFAEDMDETTVIAGNFSLEELVAQGGAVVGAVAGGFAYNDPTSVLTFTPGAILSANTWYRATINQAVADSTGNPLGTAYVYEFKTEPAPTVTNTIPANAAQFITVDTNVTVTFSENMNLAATVTDDESVITFYDDAGIPNRVTAAGITYAAGTQKLTFDPTALLTASTTYTVTILSTVADLTSNPIGANYVFTFTTEPPPSVAATTPSDTAQFIAVDSNVTVTFAEDMDETTVIAVNFDLEELVSQGGAVVGSVAGAFNYNDATNLLTFNPTAILSAATWYRATVNQVVTDSTGNPLGTNFAFEFKSEPAPTVLTTIPANSSQFIEVNVPVTVTFSEGMNLAATVTDDEIVITFYDDAGVPNRITAAGIAYDAGTQKLTFTPAGLLTANTTYTVTVLNAVTDLTGNPLAANYIFTFTIEPNATIAATSPSDAAQFLAVNTNVTVTFAEDMDETTVIAGNFSFDELASQGGAVVGPEAGSFNYNDATNLLTYDPTALLKPSTWYRATVSQNVTDSTGNPLGTNYVFEFKAEPAPTVTTTTPANTSQFIAVNTTVTVTFSENMNLLATPPDDEAVITFYDGGTRITAAGITYASGTQELTFTPAAVLSANTTYTVTVLAAVADLTGNPLGANYVFTFTTEPNPAVAATTPSDTAQFIAVNADVTVTFAEDMDAATATAGKFTLEELAAQGGAVVGTEAGAFNYNDPANLLTFNPTGVLNAVTWYRATVDQTVADSSGNVLGADYVFEFKTEPSPTVLTTIPADTSQFIQVNVPITITFSEDMNLAATVTDDETVVTFYDGGTRITAVTITYDAGTQKLQFTPAALLTASTTYTVTVLSTVADLTGNPLGANYVFTFTIEPNSTIAATTPSDIAQFIAVDTNVTVTFAEDMDAATVIAGNFSLEELVAQGGAVVGAVAGAFAYNDGTNLLTFNPTGVLSPAIWYRATIDATVTDQTGNPLGTDYTFEFKTEPSPTVVTTTPANTAQFIAIDTSVSVTFSENMNLAATIADDESVITFYQGGTRITAATITYAAGTQKLTFTPAALLSANTVYTVTILQTVSDLSGNPLGANYQFAFTTEPAPTISTTIPADSAQFIAVDTTYSATFSENMNLAATLTDDESVISFYDGGTRITAAGIAYNAGAQQLTFTPAAALTSNTTYTVTILSTVADLTGNQLGSNYQYTFTVEPAPTVAATTPADTAQFILVNTNVSATFSENMDETTVIAANFSLEELAAQGGAVVGAATGVFGYDDINNVLTFNPDNVLAAETWYRATANQAISDQSGNLLGTDFTWEFKTEPAPTVATTAPANSAQFVPVNTTVAVTFGEVMNLPATITDDETVVTVYDNAGVPNRVTAANISFVAGTMKLTFTPATSLAANTVYTVTVLSTITDLTGNPLGSNYAFSFTTEPSPAIAATSPSNLAQFLQVDTDVTATFAENMDETTVIAVNYSFEELAAQGGAVVGTVTGTFGYNDATNVLTFNPTALLSANTWYRSTINQVVADQTGNSLGSNYTFEFKTEPSPTVLTTIPANTSQFIEVNVPVTATFSENMNLPATITDDESVITFYDDAGTPNRITAAGITYDAGTQKLTFTPAALLTANTT